MNRIYSPAHCKQLILIAILLLLPSVIGLPALAQSQTERPALPANPPPYIPQIQNSPADRAAEKTTAEKNAMEQAAADAQRSNTSVKDAKRGDFDEHNEFQQFIEQSTGLH